MEFADFNREYLIHFGKNYVEDMEPSPFMIFDRDPKTGVFRPNKQRSYLPKGTVSTVYPEELSRFSQKDRKEFFKNKELQNDMERLIRMFRRRDTKGNI